MSVYPPGLGPLQNGKSPQVDGVLVSRYYYTISGIFLEYVDLLVEYQFKTILFFQIHFVVSFGLVEQTSIMMVNGNGFRKQNISATPTGYQAILESSGNIALLFLSMRDSNGSQIPAWNQGTLYVKLTNTGKQ